MASCSNTEDTAKDEIMPRRKTYDKGKDCIRCKSARGQIVIRHCLYCKDCFYHTVSLKFRKAMASLLTPGPRSKTPRKKGDKCHGSLLLAYSGGIGSTILLDMVQRRYIDGIDDSNPDERDVSAKRRPPVWKAIKVAYVEQCAAYKNVPDRTAEVKRIVSRYPEFSLQMLRLEDAFDPEWWGRNARPGPLSINLPSFSTSNFDSTDTPAERLHTFLAAQPTPTGVQHAVATLTRLLVQHLALREGSSHLLLGTNFIMELERDYPSTVSAISRTCEKVEPKGTAADSCALCKRPVQLGDLSWKTRISILRIDPDRPLPSANDNRASLEPHLCYNCHTSLTSRNNRSSGVERTHVPLPLWAGDAVATSTADGHVLTMEEKVNKIKDFLIVDDDEI
ncbi:hypothetical protein FRB99_006627 [Tulasnella sp. 403]|nr:hypothetical protein FRB99_006627 [Tulasnella sp. 403]